MSGRRLVQGTSRRAWSVEKNGSRSVGKSRGGWNTKLHLVSADDGTCVVQSLSSGECRDAPQGRVLVATLDKKCHKWAGSLMDKTCEDDEIRGLARKRGLKPVVPPKKNRLKPWRYNKQTCKKRSMVERAFMRLDAFRKICRDTTKQASCSWLTSVSHS